MIKAIFGTKLGMTQFFDGGDLIGATLIKVQPAVILEKIDRAGKTKVKIASFKIDNKKKGKIKKPMAGYFEKMGVDCYKVIKEVDIDPGAEVTVKAEAGIGIFKDVKRVDVRSLSKGKGFQGGMRRHNWRGQPRTHGATSHRRIGSVGASTYPAKIIKGLGMPGHMGDEYVTVRNLKVVKIDEKRGVLFLQGSVPGSAGAKVMIKKK